MNKAVEEKLDKFFTQYPKVSFTKGDIIINEGSPVSHIYYLKNGNVKLSMLSSNGYEITLHIFKPISYFPIMISLSNAQQNYTLTALTNVTLQKAPVAKMIAFLQKENDVLFDLATRLSQGLAGLTERIEQDMFTNARHKITSLLAYLARHFGEKKDKGTRITLKLTHEDIASWTGLARETVSRQLEQMTKQGSLVFSKQEILIYDLGPFPSQK